MNNRFVDIYKPKVKLHNPGIHWQYAQKDGSPVRKIEISWKKINGIVIITKEPYRLIFLTFRRFDRTSISIELKKNLKERK